MRIKRIKQPSQQTDTSIAAYKANLAVAGTQRARVWRNIRDAGASGVTDQEIQLDLEMTACTEHPRRGELVKKGLVEDSGRRRMTNAGRSAIVWRLVP